MLAGCIGADILTGSAGIDNLYGNSGNGGDGAVDTLVFAPRPGTGADYDFAFDFEAGTDKLDLSAYPTNFAVLTLTAVSGGYEYVYLGTTLIAAVANEANLLHQADFVF